MVTRRRDFSRFFHKVHTAKARLLAMLLKIKGLRPLDWERDTVEFLIDPAGRSRKAGRRNIAAAVTQSGCVYLRSIDHPPSRDVDDRTVIVTLQPALLSDAAIVSTANKLADLCPNRVVLLAEGSKAQCFVFSDSVLAVRTINTLANGDGVSGAAQPINAHGRPI
jgi:hypothetical protein